MLNYCTNLSGQGIGLPLDFSVVEQFDFNLIMMKHVLASVKVTAVED